MQFLFIYMSGPDIRGVSVSSMSWFTKEAKGIHWVARTIYRSGLINCILNSYWKPANFLDRQCLSHEIWRKSTEIHSFRKEITWCLFLPLLQELILSVHILSDMQARCICTHWWKQVMASCSCFIKFLWGNDIMYWMQCFWVY